MYKLLFSHYFDIAWPRQVILGTLLKNYFRTKPIPKNKGILFFNYRLRTGLYHFQVHSSDSTLRK